MTTAAGTARTTARGAPRPAVRLLLLAAVAAVALGVLGMHALLPHGTAHHVTAHHVTAHHGAHDLAGGAVAVEEAGAVAPAPDGTAVDPLVLCAALLAAAAVTLALLRALVDRVPRGARVRRPLLRALPPVRRTARWATGPPPEWAWSVVRC